MCRWAVKYRSKLKNTTQILPTEHVTIGAKRGRPLLLLDDLDFKLRSFLTNLRTADGTINRHVLYGVLMGLIKSDLARYGQYLESALPMAGCSPCILEWVSHAEW